MRTLLKANNSYLGRACSVAFLFLVFAACSGTGRGADPVSPSRGHAGQDWPMWRCDASRSAVTEEELPADLHLQWVRQYPRLQPMGSGCRDLTHDKTDKHVVGFEVVYSPIVLGTTMFVGSSVNDSLTAIDVETGKEKWRFFTEGPVRLASAGWKRKVYVTSDDGFLYCLDAADGKLVWKFRGGPMKHRVIGDERLISAWPARGGAVVAPSANSGGATVYFTASIWPFMGIYIYALDAETGKVLWVNDERGAHWNGKSETTAPQGPLTIIGDRLLIPNNRLGTTCLDRATGEFLYCTRDRALWKICGAGKYFITSDRKVGAQLHDLETGSLLGNLNDVPVLAGETLYWAEGRGDRAAVGQSDLTKIEPVTKKNKKEPNRAEIWRLDGVAPDARGNLRVKLKAGSRLYAASSNIVVAVNTPTETSPATKSWTGTVEGTIGEMLAAAGRLFVITHEGSIYCFGAEKRAPVTHTVSREELTSQSDAWSKQVGKILKSTGVSDGYAVVLGIGSGRLMEELLVQSKLRVIGVDPDAGRVDALRRKLDKAGLYGGRAVVFAGAPTDCGLPPYLASLIVSEDPTAAGIAKGQEFVQSVFRSLRPYGGVMCLPAAQVSQSVLKGWVESATLERADVRQAGQFTLLARVGALPGSAPWTHHNADEGNTISSRDDLVRAPLGLLWFGGPSGTLTVDRHYRGPRPGVVNGRIIVFGLGGLTAIDVYTGRLLWEASAPEIRKATEPYRPKRGDRVNGADVLGSPFVCVSDGIYVAGGGTCLRLDPATGKTASEITLPAGGKMQEFGPIRVWQDTLVASVDPIRASEGLFSRDRDHAAACRHLIAFDRNSGEVLWSRAADQGFSNGGIALGAGKVFCIDRWAKNPRVEVEGGKLMALDARTGKTIWQTGENVFGTWLAYSPEVDILLQGTGVHSNKNVYRYRAIAYQAADGKVLWDKPYGGGGDRGSSMLNKAVIITQSPETIDLRTGEKIKKFKGIYGRCNGYIGSAHVLTKRGAAAVYLDLQTDTDHLLGGFRPGCLNTHIPADGVLNYVYAATHCTCSYNIRTSVALMHMPELAAKKKDGEVK